MGRYIEWDDVVQRYPEIDTIGGSGVVSSTYIVYSEAFVDGYLKGTSYTPPFSSNNMTVKDLCIDYCYWRAARFKLEDAIEVKSAMFETLQLIKNNELMMINDDGSAVVAAEINPGIYSSTQSYHSSFGIDDPLDWRISSDHMSDAQDSRL
jgi:hypothetical protein